MICASLNHRPSTNDLHQRPAPLATVGLRVTLPSLRTEVTAWRCTACALGHLYDPPTLPTELCTPKESR